MPGVSAPLNQLPSFSEFFLPYNAKESPVLA